MVVRTGVTTTSKSGIGIIVETKRPFERGSLPEHLSNFPTPHIGPHPTAITPYDRPLPSPCPIQDIFSPSIRAQPVHGPFFSIIAARSGASRSANSGRSSRSPAGSSTIRKRYGLPGKAPRSNFEDRMEVKFNKIVEQHASRCVAASQDRAYRNMAKALNAQGDLLHTLEKRNQNLT